MKTLNSKDLKAVTGGSALDVVKYIVATVTGAYAAGYKKGSDKAKSDNATGSQQCTWTYEY